MKPLRILCIGCIFLGVLLRVMYLGTPDLTTDEAQFVLGQSASHTLLLHSIMRWMQMTLGPSIIVVRLLAVLSGVGLLAFIYALARTVLHRDSALVAVAVASLTPSAILLSRLAFLTMPMALEWTILVYCVVRAMRDSSNSFWLLATFFASVSAGLSQGQGIFVTLLLLAGLLVQRRWSVFRDPLAWVLVASLLPPVLYILSHPQVFVALGIVNSEKLPFASLVLSRLLHTGMVWWNICGIAVILAVLSIPSVRKLPWQIGILTLAGVVFSLALTPQFYYATYLVFFAIPIALFLQKRPSLTIATLVVLAVQTFLFFPPVDALQNRLANPLFTNDGYWNTHIDAIEKTLGNSERVIAYGTFGHHIRWYLPQRVIVARDAKFIDDKPEPVIVIGTPVPVSLESRRVLYHDELVTVLEGVTQ